MTKWKLLRIHLPLWKDFFWSSKGSGDLSHLRVRSHEGSTNYQAESIYKLRQQPSYTTYLLCKAGQATEVSLTSWVMRINYVTQGCQRAVLSKLYLLFLLLLTTLIREMKRKLLPFSSIRHSEV